MTKRVLAIAALFFTVSTIGAFAETWNDTLSDQMCARKHVNATPSDIACAQKCFKMGSPAVFIQGDKVYQIDNQKAVASYVGYKVHLTGTMKGDTIHVEYVKK